MIRVLVVEDSPTIRQLVRSILEADPDIEVVGEAGDGAQAVDLAVELRPDLVTMDIHMPVMDGREATRAIMERSPIPIVIVTASAHRDEVVGSFEAISTGAVAVLEKPASPLSPDFDRLSRELLSTVKAVAGVKVVRRHKTRGPAAPDHHGERVVGIAASTGGPGAIGGVLEGLPSDFAAPILVVQHIAPGFVQGLVSWMGSRCRLEVKLAEQGERLRHGTVYVAPDAVHLGLAQGGFAELASRDPIGGHRPSATFLLETIAVRAGSAGVGVVLSGMGRDGLEGARLLKRAGGTVFAQDERSSVVFGMNGEIVREGLADAVLSPQRLAEQLVAIVGIGVST